MMKFIKYFVVLLWSTSAFAISPKNYLKRIKQNYDQLKKYELNLDYSLYKGYNGIEPLTTYNARYIKTPDKVYRKIQETEFIHFDNITLQINHAEKICVLSDYQTTEFLEFDLAATLKRCKSVSVSDSPQGYRIKLELKADENTIPINRIELLIDKNFWVKETTIFYSTMANFGTYFEKEMDFPKLKISYSKLKEKTNALDNVSLDQFLIESSKKVLLTDRYLDYRLIDSRKRN